MAHTHSPLRYPGGKSCLLPLVTAILSDNGLRRGHYAEPYAGGSSLALALLFSGQVSDIHLNDLDAGIFAFWHSMMNEADAFIDLVKSTPITVEEWRNQRLVYQQRDATNRLKLGFSTFFLNRTNRSGIISTAGVIGGLAQNGSYKIDCRFNREDLVNRILRINKYKSCIHLYNEDAVDFLGGMDGRLPKKTFVAIDPPYYLKGSSLYTSFYSPDDHAAVADAVFKLDRPWILTYDAADEIKRLYKDRRQYLFDIKYSVQTKRVGTELLIPSKGLRVPDFIRVHQVNRPQYRAA